jgi:hypothetical protein
MSWKLNLADRGNALNIFLIFINRAIPFDIVRFMAIRPHTRSGKFVFGKTTKYLKPCTIFEITNIFQMLIYVTTSQTKSVNIRKLTKSAQKCIILKNQVMFCHLIGSVSLVFGWQIAALSHCLSSSYLNAKCS